MFLLDIEAGKFDPDFNEPAPEAEPPSPIKESPTNGESTIITEPNGNGTVALVEEPKVGGGDDEMQFNMDAEEEGGDNVGDNDTSRVETNGKNSSKNERVTRGEEISVPPEGNQVMIRTIPPDIGRVKLEDVSVLKLAMSTQSSRCIVRLAVSFLGTCISLWATLCKSVISIVLAG